MEKGDAQENLKTEARQQLKLFQASLKQLDSTLEESINLLSEEERNLFSAKITHFRNKYNFLYEKASRLGVIND